MANNLGSLVVSLGLDAAEFTKGLSKSEYQAQQWGRRIETAVDVARAGFLSFVAGAGTALAVLDRQLESVAGFQGLADKLGDTAEAVASLKLASDVSGVSLDTFASASVKLTAALSKTDDESKGVGQALASIGIELEAFKQLRPVDQFEAVSKALGRFEDGAGKTAVAVGIFGKSGAELIPMLNDLADGAERQVSLTQQQIQAADEYSKQTARLRSEVQTLAQVTAADAVPTMSAMVQMLQDVLRYSTSAGGGVSILTLALNGAKITFQTVAVLGSDLAFVFRTLGDSIGAYIAVANRLVQFDVAGAKAIGAAYREESEARRAALDKFQTGLFTGPAAAGQSVNELSAARARRQGSAVPSGNRLAINYSPTPAGGGGARGASGGETEAQKAEKQYQDSLLQYDRDLDAYKQRMFAKRMAEQDATEKQYQDGLLQYERDLDDYKQRMFAQRLEEEEKMQLDAAARVQKAAEDAAAAQQRQADRLGDAFAATFDRMFADGMKFGDLLKKLAFDAINIAILSPATQKIGSSIGSAVASLFKSYDGGGYTGSGSRSGGLDGKGGFMAMLHPNETVLDHTRGQGMGGGMSFSYTIDARGADAGVEQRVRVALAETEARIRAAIVPTVVSAAGRGGSVAKALGRA
jgi:hypothetical protein